MATTATRTLVPRPKPELTEGGEPRAKLTGRAPQEKKAGPKKQYEQHLLWVNVTDPQDIKTKDRTTRKSINVHANKEYFRGKKLKTVERLNASRTPFDLKVEAEEKLPTATADPLSECHCRELYGLVSDSQKCPTCRTAALTVDYKDVMKKDTALILSPSKNSTLMTLIGEGRVDPFNSHPINITHPTTHGFIDCFGSNFYENPILNFHTPSSHPLLPFIMRWSLDDPALLNAVLCAGATSIVFRTSRKEVSPTAIAHKGKAISLLNQKLRDPAAAANDASTFITIMILAALEYDVRNRAGHEAHMRGLVHLLKLRNVPQDSHLAQWMIKYGLFRIDQSGFVITGSQSFLPPDLFPFQVLTALDSGPRSLHSLPLGFRANASILSDQLLSIILDIPPLQEKFALYSRASSLPLSAVIAFSDAEASIGYRLSRLQPPPNLPSTLTAMHNCVRLAVYISSSAMFDLAFGVNPMRIYLSVQLGQSLLSTDVRSEWSEHIDLLLWMLFIGGTFARNTPVLPLYQGLLRGVVGQLGDLVGTWGKTKQILETFFWIDKGFERTCEALWREARGVGQ